MCKYLASISEGRELKCTITYASPSFANYLLSPKTNCLHSMRHHYCTRGHLVNMSLLFSDK